MTDPSWNWGESPNFNSAPSTSNRNASSDYYRHNALQQSNNNATPYPPAEFFQPSAPPQSAQQWSPDQWYQPSAPPAPSQPFPTQHSPPGVPVNNLGQMDGTSFGAYYAPPSAANSNTVAYSSSFPQQIISDPLFNTARQIGGQFAEQQREKLSNYLSSFQLKYYFAVNTKYVGKKLGVILFPFLHRDWTTKFGQGNTPLPAREDVNAPDLYIPLMAFITYVLVSGFVFGLQKRFSPEKLGMLTTNALFYLILENVLVFITKYVLNISHSLNVWHALSYSTYKFVGMVSCLLLYLVGGSSIYYIGLAYCIFSTVFFLLRSLKTFILDIGYTNDAGDGGRKRKLYLLLSITVLQSIIMWLMTSSVTSYMPAKYDFAKMAIGLAKSGAVNSPNVPLQPDGEVDYEALLKMP